MDTKEQILVEQKEKLPGELQELIDQGGWIKVVSDTAKSHDLSESQMKELLTEVELLVHGLSHPGEFEKNLKENSSIPDPAIGEIVEEIQLMLFPLFLQPLLEYWEFEESSDETKNEELDIEYGQTKNSLENEDDSTESKEELLAGIENPTSITKSDGSQQKPNILDAKLSGTTSIPSQKATLNNPNPNKKYMSDPYREPLE